MYNTTAASSLNPVAAEATENAAEALQNDVKGSSGSRALTLNTLFIWYIVILVITIIRRKYFSPISHIPGPAVASFTRFWHIKQIWAGEQSRSLIKEHEKHGAFVRVAHNEVSVSHPAAVKLLYLNTVPKGSWYSVFVFPDWRFPSAVSMRDPKAKAEFMKYFSNAGFLQHNLIHYQDIMDSNMRKLMSWLNKYAEDQNPMDLDKFFTYVAYDITGEVTFSQAFGFMDQGKDVGGAVGMNVALQLFLCTFGHYIWASYLFNNPLMTWSQLLPVGHLVNTARTALAQRQKNPDQRFDMASHWIRGLEKAKKAGYTGYSENHLLSAAVSNLGAGSDTVSCGMQTFVYNLLRQPANWARVRAEIDAAVQIGECASEIITFEEASKLPYLSACINESLRFLPPVSMGLPRVAPQGGITIGDQHFVEGTTLSINPAVLHFNTEIWGPDAKEFNPDRWLAADIASKEKYFMPFSLGWGSCPGQNLARIQLYKVLTTLVRDFDLRLVNPDQEWKWEAYFTTNPHSWPVYVSKREKRA